MLLDYFIEYYLIVLVDYDTDQINLMNHRQHTEDAVLCSGENIIQINSKLNIEIYYIRRKICQNYTV